MFFRITSNIIKLFALALLCFLKSCATYNKQSNLIDIIQSQNNTFDDQSKTSFYLFGDADQIIEDKTPKAIITIEEKFKNANNSDVLLFLVDNIYLNGY